jgi:hypothetical protein
LFQNVNLRKESKQGRKEPESSGEKCKGSYKYSNVFLVRKIKKSKKFCMNVV